ncbi:RNA polymerase sigma factor [Candidatus Saccharibacteria bacterium]|nr:RNA polymerase sigma factor [Candidatus Saccharibacteria bacterium]NCU40823.1 RNA polymerase sigma factor [Candidatus Saccharibacteria bacterium]
MASNRLEVTDESIVASIVAGDIDAYADILARYEAKLHRYVVYLIHNQTMADDIVQDTFIKAYQNLQGFNSKYKFSSWIYRIAHNEAMNAIKKVRHMADDDIDELPDTSYDQRIEEVVDSDILKAHVQGCLGKLEPKYREVIQLVYFEHMKYEEVSDILHVPTSTVGVWLSRAKTRLKELCKQRGVKR